jgi:DNA mismatch repair ATPase MutS
LQIFEKEIMASREQLLKLNTFVCQLDAYLSLAIAKDTFGLLIAPKFTDFVQDAKIVQGRNLMAELSSGSFQPLDFQLYGSGVKLLVAGSGAGKSTWMLTLG